jgi:hypothetical protein
VTPKDKDPPRRRRFGDQRIAERAIVLEVLRSDHARRWTRAQLEDALSDVQPEVVESAFEDLASEGVIELVARDQARASRCTRRLNALKMISI